MLYGKERMAEMLILVTGGSCSGKSGFAEGLLAEAGADTKKYYIATMDAADEESKARVQRHRTQRAPKGFVTIEQARDVHLAAGEIQAERKISERTAALLECMSNLTANEMFGVDKVQSEQVVIEKVCRDIAQLEKTLDLLIIVTNNVFEDGVQYDESTESYLRALGRINAWLAEWAEQVYEVVVGVPILWKK